VAQARLARGRLWQPPTELAVTCNNLALCCKRGRAVGKAAYYYGEALAAARDEAFEIPTERREALVAQARVVQVQADGEEPTSQPPSPRLASP